MICRPFLLLLCIGFPVATAPNVDASRDTPLHGHSEADQEVFNRAAVNAAEFLDAEYGVSYPQPLTEFQHSVEQSTYLEWVNSRYYEDGTAQACQNCHMKRGFRSADGSIAYSGGSAHSFRGIRPPVTRCREAACFGYQV